ncbi:uncharacterized protein [Struthio camelus]|uniref:uncharacterized protein isoform X3 n=1 Tax=Struthio camelus TaxID=8801 RepID=UPI003603B50B
MARHRPALPAGGESDSSAGQWPGGKKERRARGRADTPPPRGTAAVGVECGFLGALRSPAEPFRRRSRHLSALPRVPTSRPAEQTDPEPPWGAAQRDPAPWLVAPAFSRCGSPPVPTWARAEPSLAWIMPKRKCKFTEELQAKYPCFRVGRERWEAECLVCQEGTYVSVANKGSLDLEAHVQSMKHKRNVLGGGSAAKLASCFLPADCQPFDVAAENALGFPTTVLQDCCDSLASSPGLAKMPEPGVDVLGLQIKTEARLEEALAPFGLDRGVGDPLDGVPFCGVALAVSASDGGTPFPIQIRYFDWKRGGLQTRVMAVEPEPGEPAPAAAAAVLAWEILERHGLRQKCVAIVGDSRNAMFGGLGPAEGPVDVPGLRELLKGAFIATDCPAHILSNCIQHGADSLEVDIQSVVWKIYTYVSVYAVWTEPLKDFLEFAKREYRRLLYHGRTPWLLLLPAITRLLQAFPALKSFFLSLNKPPFAIKNFFEDDFSEIYLQHMASQVAVFDMHLKTLAREDNSLSEVLGVLASVRRTLLERRAHGFMSLRVKELLAERRAAGRDGQCDAFCRHVQSLYVAFVEYLDAQTGQFEELSCFQWMQLRGPPSWEDVEACIKYLADHGVAIDDNIWTLPEMSSLFVRRVEIEIANKTRNVTLHTPRSYCFSGYSCIPPSPKIPPGATGSCQFTNVVLSFRGSVGVLVYEADSFTLAILFSNPYDYNIFNMEVALEISMEKAHLGSLEDVYKRMYNSLPAGNIKDTTFQRAKLHACQETLTVSSNHVRVMATMSNAADSVIKVIVEDKDSSPLPYSVQAPPGSLGQYQHWPKNWKYLLKGNTAT